MLGLNSTYAFYLPFPMAPLKSGLLLSHFPQSSQALKRKALRKTYWTLFPGTDVKKMYGRRLPAPCMGKMVEYEGHHEGMSCVLSGTSSKKSCLAGWCHVALLYPPVLNKTVWHQINR